MKPNGDLLEDWRQRALALEDEVKKVLVGQDRVVRLIDIAVFARGHVLVEGDVGVGKTTALRAFARALGGAFERVEGTVDMMPSDLVYYAYIDASGRPRVDPGPLLKHGGTLCVFFFNEINRTRPQVQALLLRAMAERSVSAFNHEHWLPHLTVFADRNRVEKEETFELSAAARDRFMLEVQIDLPADDAILSALAFDPVYHDVDTLVGRVAAGIVPYTALEQIGALIQDSVHTSETLRRYVLDLWRATREPRSFGVRIDGVDMERLILAGASPRGMSMLLRAARVAAWLQGRDFMTPEDIQSVWSEAIGHRVFFTPVYEMRREEVARTLLREITERVAAP